MMGSIIAIIDLQQAIPNEREQIARDHNTHVVLTPPIIPTN